MPGAAGFLQKAGPAFEAYAAGQHETAVAAFMSAMRTRRSSLDILVQDVPNLGGERRERERLLQKVHVLR